MIWLGLALRIGLRMIFTTLLVGQKSMGDLVLAKLRKLLGKVLSKLSSIVKFFGTE
jgi:hypothetical protein